jgi:hypothetical protein
LRNRFGPIIVTGIGGDTLEATVTEIKKGAGEYKFRVVASRSGKDRITVTTSVSTTGQSLSEKEDKIKGGAQGTGVGAAGQQTPKPPKPTPSSQPAQQREPKSGAQGAVGGGPAPTPRPPRQERTDSPPLESLRVVGELRLDVKLPRNAHIDLIDSRRYAVTAQGNPSYLTNTRNDVYIANIETPISVISSGDVTASKVGGLEAKTRASKVYVNDIAGPVSISTVTGTIVVKDADGDVRAVSISGTISIECAKGRTEASTATGTIMMVGIGGDVDVTSTGGTISFTGAIRDGGRYRMKSMTGSVVMLIQKEPPGFLASLSSYKGQILDGFGLKAEPSASTSTSDLPVALNQTGRRVVGRYGQGDARITLDSFSGTVQLARAQSEAWKKCR